MLLLSCTKLWLSNNVTSNTTFVPTLTAVKADAVAAVVAGQV